MMINLRSKYGNREYNLKDRPFFRPEFHVIDELDDPLRPSKGVLVGLFLGAVIWGILMVVWFLTV